MSLAVRAPWRRELLRKSRVTNSPLLASTSTTVVNVVADASAEIRRLHRIRTGQGSPSFRPAEPDWMWTKPKRHFIHHEAHVQRLRSPHPLSLGPRSRVYFKMLISEPDFP